MNTSEDVAGCGAMEVVLDGCSLTVSDVVAIARDEESERTVAISPRGEQLINQRRTALDRLVATGQPIYGITTGVGAFQEKYILPEDVLELQRNLVVSHSAAVGPALPEEAVRASMLARANTLAKGLSGITVPTLQALIDMLNRRVHPVIPSQGSVGASGDLAPLAHMTLVMVGLGEAVYQGERMSGADALERAGLSPVRLQAKEAMALINGTAVMTGIGALAVHDAGRLLCLADAIGALTLEALGGLATPFGDDVHRARPQPGQVESAARVRAFVAGSQLLGHETVAPAANGRVHVQDPYCLRCMPQVHGASGHAIDYARATIEIELNAATDNPLFLDAGDGPRPISQGNFHGQPVALAMDFLGIAVAELASISERRIARLTGQRDGTIPWFLAGHGGVNSGFMMAQHTAASLVSENKVLAHPASVDSIPTCDNWEDHVSMGTTAARKAAQIVANAERVLGIELLLAAQAADFRLRALGLQPEAGLGRGTLLVYQAVRQVVPFVSRDVVLAPLMEAASCVVRDDEVYRQLEMIGNEGRFPARPQSRVAHSRAPRRRPSGDRKGRCACGS